jgi:hypothetical protein
MRYLLSILLFWSVSASQAQVVTAIPKALMQLRTTGTNGNRVEAMWVQLTPPQTNEVFVNVRISGGGANAFGDGSGEINTFLRFAPGQERRKLILLENGTGAESGSISVALLEGSNYTLGDRTTENPPWDRTGTGDAIPTVTAPTISLLTPSDSATADTEWAVPFTSSYTSSGEHRIGSIAYQVFNAGSTKVADVAADMIESGYAATATLATSGTYTAKAVLYYTDENGVDQTVESSTISITATDPSITTSITSPADAATLTVDVATSVQVSASASSGGITQVELFEDGVSVFVDGASPFNIPYTPTSLGAHNLTVTATRTLGGTASDSIDIVCIPAANQAPTAELSFDAASSDAEFPTLDLRFDYVVSDADGTVDQIELRMEGSIIQTLSSGPYTTGTLTFNGVSPAMVTDRGYVFDIIATDDDAATTTSSYANVVTTTASTPAYTFTGPGDGSAEVGQTITLTSNQANGTADSLLYEKVSGPGTITFGTATAISTTASFDTAGIYVVRVTSTKGATSYVREGTYTITALPYQFTGPADLTLVVDESGTLTATEANGPADSYAWAKTAGTGTVTFGTSTAISTSVSVDTAGTFTITVTATKDGTPYVRTVTLTITAADTYPEPGDPPTPDAVNNITLPVLVFDHDDQTDGIASKTVTFKTDSTFAQASGTVMELNVPNLHHGNTLSFRINGGTERLIRDTTATVDHNALNNHGTADGYLGDFSFKVLRVPITDGVIVAGSNTITFTFRAPWSAGFTSTGITYDQGHFQTAGYRIVYFNFLETDGDRLLDSSDFVVTDYTAFTAPAGGTAATGQTLWENDTILTSNPNNQAAKRTACFDCHGSGAPLHYFHFENDVIIARSRFHGLTTQQGTDIAAYIRSLTPAQTSTNARPWSLPYQPGPNLANLTTHEWAAGEMKAHAIVPDLKIPDVLANSDAHRTEIYGATIENSDLTFSNSTDSEWQTRIHFQLPSYQQWVADFHPKEFMGSRTSWNASNLKREHDQFRAKFTSAASNSSAIYDWRELDLYSYRFIENEMRTYFSTMYFQADEFAYPYSVKKLASVLALDMEMTWNLSSVDLYSSVAWDHSREYPRAATFFNTSPLQSHVATGYTGHAVGNRTDASKRFLDVGWYAVQMYVNPWMGGDNRFLDSGRGYFYGASSDWLSKIPGGGEPESLFALMHQLNVCMMRMSQQDQNVNNRSGGAYLPHFNPQVLSDNQWLANADKGDATDKLAIMLAAVENFIDFLDTIPVATWQTASVVSSMTSGASSTGFRDDSKQLSICYMLLHNLKNNWGVSTSHATYVRARDKFALIWPSQATWP